MENLFFCFFKHEKLPVTEYTHPYTNPAPLHTHNFFEFLVPIEGNTENIYKGTTQTLSPGELLLLRPNDEHALSIPKNTKHLHRDVYVWPEKMQKICAMLSADLYDKIMSANEPLYFNIGMKKLQILQEQLDRFDLEKADIIDYESYHTCIVFELLGFYIDHQIQHISSLPEWLQTLLSLLNQPEVMALPIDDIIASTNYSRGYVYDAFKQYTGKSIGKYLTENRMNYSVILLADTDMPISRIATKLGYDSQNSFTRNFQEQFGITPAAWRKRNRSKSSDNKNIFS